MLRHDVGHVAMREMLGDLQSSSHDMTPAATGLLIDYLITHYHDAHRQELPELFRLARTVEAIHADHPAVPSGLANLISELQNDLNSHMRKEEDSLFPLLKKGTALPPIYSVAKLRREHDLQKQLLHRIHLMTNSFKIPDDACQTWRTLYHGLAKFADDFAKHVHLENTVLFAQIDQTTPDSVEHSSCCGSCA